MGLPRSKNRELNPNELNHPSYWNIVCIHWERVEWQKERGQFNPTAALPDVQLSWEGLKPIGDGCIPGVGPGRARHILCKFESLELTGRNLLKDTIGQKNFFTRIEEKQWQIETAQRRGAV